MSSVQGVDITKKRGGPVRPWPMPEALTNTDNEPWDIKEVSGRGVIGGTTSRKAHQMYVPLTEGEIGLNIRAHEMAHAQWSPDEPDRRYDLQIQQCVEDARMHLKLGKAGVDIYGGLLDEYWRDKNVENLRVEPDKYDKRGAVLTMLSAVGTQNYDLFYQTTLAKYYEVHEKHGATAAQKYHDTLSMSQQIREFMQNSELQYEDTLAATGMLELMLNPPPPPKAPPSSSSMTKPMSGPPISMEELMKMRGLPMPKEEGMSEEEAEAAMREAIKDKYGDINEFEKGTSPKLSRNTTFFPWGEMHIEPLRTSLPIPGNFYSKRWRAGDSGYLPKYMHRYPVDQQIFGTKKKVKGGTVLIDGSGSMSLSKEEVWDIMQAAPGATVAIYSGNSSDGKLRILVQKNRRVEDHLICPPAGGGNTVDGPALRWLLKQRGPRIWVSDGYVVGVNGAGPGNVAECEALCRAGSVMRVENAKKAVEVFNTLFNRR